ncbi:Hsp20/alpha crystallin family protein [Mucilaginibacter sp. 3215]|uniref:Hsp20/alpha crystallin family protein n=1 Tax=Mucilaginibacter sp. 3215 TaxID=3373912 RepID=UPI003D21FC96
MRKPIKKKRKRLIVIHVKNFPLLPFRRTFKLPDNVKEDGVNANYHNGLLEIELKKSGRNQAAKKEIKVD